MSMRTVHSIAARAETCCRLWLTAKDFPFPAVQGSKSREGDVETGEKHSAMKHLSATVFVMLAWLGAVAMAATQSGSATTLVGAIGHVGTIPYDVGTTPKGYESWFAIVVVEIESPASMSGVTVSKFHLIDDKAKTIEPSRIVSVEEFVSMEEFTRAIAANKSPAAYWITGEARAWDETGA